VGRNSGTVLSFDRRSWSALLLTGSLAALPEPLVAQSVQGSAWSAPAGVEHPGSTAVGVPAELTLTAPAWTLDALDVSNPVASGRRFYHAQSLGPRSPDGRTSVQTQASPRPWPTLLRISLGAVVGAATGKLVYDEACARADCKIDHYAVTSSFAALGGLAGFLLGRSDRSAVRTVPAGTSHPADEIWQQMREIPVPAAPPDSLPAWLYTRANVAPPTRFIARPFVSRIVLLAFYPWAPVNARQHAVDLVHGAVIGGEPVLDGEGLYYLLIPDDVSGRGIREAVDMLSARREVALAAPRYADER